MSKIFVVMKKCDHENVIRRIDEKACAGWKELFELVAVDERRNARKNNANPMAYVKVTDDIVDKLGEGDYSLLVVQKDVAVDVKRLGELDIKLREVRSVDVLVDFIFDKLKKNKLYWLDHAIHQWGKSSIPKLHPDAWAQQFALLGVPWVGTNLLKLLKVISNDELTNAFTIPPEDFAGLKVVHAYFRDTEPGSSSLNIRNILEHLYPSEQIVEYDPDNPGALRDLNKDIIYLYEDGLWSGVELVKRLDSIFKNIALQNTRCQIHFCYGVTCDAGLMAGRLYSKRVGMMNVQLRPADRQYHYSLIPQEDRNMIESLVSPSDDDIRKAIDGYIRPLAFQSEQFWFGRRAEALWVCESIGCQLVGKFLERRRQAKLPPGDAGAVKLDPISEDKLMGWALGALRFGSTVSFASSIPKPVLPLMWLDGPVCLNGKTVDWRPLFWDVRRTGSVNYPDQADFI